MKNPYRRNSSQLNSDINVVPYIDVMLVLLVIFMVTTPMMTSGVDIDLPKEKADSINTGTLLPIIVSMNLGNELYIADDSGQEQQISDIQLKEYLVDKQQQSKTSTGQDIQVMLQADKKIAYGDIMTLMASLQQAGIVKVGLITDPNS